MWVRVLRGWVRGEWEVRCSSVLVFSSALGEVRLVIGCAGICNGSGEGEVGEGVSWCWS